MQRHLGDLRGTQPTPRLAAAISTWKRIVRQNHDPRGGTFLEIGTGRVPVVPLAYWLMGADKTITIDRNPYLQGELVREHLDYVSAHPEEIRELFGALLDERRFSELLELSRAPRFTTREFLDLCRVQYLAPGDAAETGLPSVSVDFHTSFTVLEHIPPAELVRIFREGNRIVRSGGLFVHNIDYSDHFSHSDETITAINFLQYSDHEWERYAGNRYMYMNRLRHDDFLELYNSVGHQILAAEPRTDDRVRELLASGALRVDDRFRNKPQSVLAISSAWIVSRNAQG
jgi:hypothetical protein